MIDKETFYRNNNISLHFRHRVDQRDKGVDNMTYVTNSFSINMVSGACSVDFNPITVEEASHLLDNGFTSGVGHPDTAHVVSGILGKEVVPNRVNVQLTKGDLLIVAQYTGPRLPEGATTLPEGATINFWKVEVTY